jgi:hypothetical protein
LQTHSLAQPLGGIRGKRFRAETREDHLGDAASRAQCIADRPHRDPRRRLERIAVNARADRRKRDAPERVIVGELHRFAIGGRKQLRLALGAALPDRPDGVDDKPRGQEKARRDARLANRTRSGARARAGQLGSGGIMNGAADSAARRQAAVRRVDNRINRERGDVDESGFDRRYQRKLALRETTFGETTGAIDAATEFLRIILRPSRSKST